MNGELRQIERGSLLKVRDRLFNGFTLRGCSRLRIQGDVATFLGRGKYCGQFHFFFSKHENLIVAQSLNPVIVVPNVGRLCQGDGLAA